MLPESLLSEMPLAELIALKPISYLTRLLIACVAFGAAMNPDKVIARVIGLVWLLIAGGGFLMLGVTKETIVDLLLGLVALGAAGYAWWYTRA